MSARGYIGVRLFVVMVCLPFSGVHLAGNNTLMFSLAYFLGTFAAISLANRALSK